MVDCAGRLVVEAFYGSDQIVIDVIQPHGCPHFVERFLAVHEDMVKALLVLQIFLTEYSEIENLPSCAPSCSLKPACSSLMISSACGFSLFGRIVSMTLLE